MQGEIPSSIDGLGVTPPQPRVANDLQLLRKRLRSDDFPHPCCPWLLLQEANAPSIPHVVRRGAAYCWRRRIPSRLAESPGFVTLLLGLRTRAWRLLDAMGLELSIGKTRISDPTEGLSSSDAQFGICRPRFEVVEIAGKHESLRESAPRPSSRRLRIYRRPVRRRRWGAIVLSWQVHRLRRQTVTRLHLLTRRDPISLEAQRAVSTNLADRRPSRTSEAV